MPKKKKTQGRKPTGRTMKVETKVTPQTFEEIEKRRKFAGKKRATYLADVLEAMFNKTVVTFKKEE